MTGAETWNKLQPLLWAIQDVANEEWKEIYVNVFNGLKKLDEVNNED